jgi:integrase
MPALTSSAIEAVKPTAKNQDLTIEKLGMGRGCLILRVLPDGKKIFYYRHFVGGAKKFVLLGSFNSKGKRNWEGIRGIMLTLAAAKEGAKNLADIVAEYGDVETYDIKQTKQLALETSRGSFSQLLNAYIQSLKDSERVRTNKVEGTINLHVIKAHPELMDYKAKDIGSGDVQTILAALVQKGRTRQVNLLRSYLHAAFNYAARHDNDPRRIATQSVSFNLELNPVALIPQIAEFNKTSERTLNREELLLFLKELDTAPVIPATFLKLLIALGGQRFEQLLRAEWSDYNFDTRVLSLKDSKGRPGLGVRDHLVPLTEWAVTILKPLRELNDNAHPFTSIGTTRMDVGTPSKLAKKIAEKMKTEHGLETFRAGDLRRTCETLLASIGVTKEIRAQLLSHGRSSGVQAKHYDRYAYLPEKRAALEKWQVFLTNDS